MAKKTTTLLIEDTTIKIVVTQGKHVVSWARAPLEPGLVSDGVILNEAEVAARLKQIFSLEKISARKVIVALSGLNTLYRLITLPVMPKAVLAEAVRHEVSREMPVSLDEVYLSYQPVTTIGNETLIFVATFPRSGADAMVRTLNKAGLQPYLMDLVPLALCRTVSEPKAIITRVWINSLDIIIMVDRVPQVIRSLSLPGEAETLSDKVPIISEELERTIAFYNSSHLEEPLDSTVPILVSGELAEAKEWWESLSSGLGHQVSMIPPPLECPDGLSPGEFMVNMGLALKGLPENGEGGFSLVNFNALPEAYLPEAPHLGRILAPIGGVVGIALLIYMIYMAQSATDYTKALQAELIPLEARITQQQKDIPALRKELTAIQAQVPPIIISRDTFNTELSLLAVNHEHVYRDLSELVEKLPEALNLTTVSYSGNIVDITGTTADVSNIFEYARRLRDGDRFDTVIILSIEQERAGEMIFNFYLN